MVKFPIDFVVPYVNNFDEVWRKQYTDFCIQNNMRGRIEAIDRERYRDFGYLKFLFRGIAQNMPFIRKVFLIVSNPEQVPSWVDTQIVQVVLHKDFIPAQYLPTFNSTTIEMFLPDIKGLATHFIYGNDDIYTINSTTPEDYFTDSGFPKVSVELSSNKSQEQFWRVCRRNSEKIIEALGMESPDGFYIPTHSLTPINKTLAKKTRKLLGDSLFESLSNFRTDTNYNQYVYTIYTFLNNYSVPSERTVKYINMAGKDTYGVISTLKNDTKTQEFILNDTEKTEKFIWKLFRTRITDAFTQRFQNISKYEVKT